MASFLKYALYLVLLAGAVALGLFAYSKTRITVTLERPTRGPAVDAVYATGTVEPVYWSKVAPLGTGRIAAILARDGDPVKKGTVLARLEDQDKSANVMQLAARRDFLKDELIRAQNLQRKGFFSTQALERAASDLKQAEAALAAANKPLADTLLTAPIDGVVLRQDGEAGETVLANQTLFWVGLAKPLRVIAEVDEEDIARVHPGQRVLIKADAFPGVVLEGLVAEITPKGDPINKSYRVRVSLPDDTPLKVGMTTETNILVREEAHALLVPAAALSGGKLWVAENGRAKRLPVKTGTIGEKKAEILSGLKGDETVIANPPPELKEGERVNIGQPRP
ncbi:MAG: efflux RND transporter periplasmic adaptor subunit [Sulfuricella sp.]|nr:efflux RND transporter periplasmic adaptor subunit [Sulfuricella sp.]